MSALSLDMAADYRVKSKLGTWLAETSGSFHPSLVFRTGSASEETSSIAECSTNMGISIFTEKTIYRQEVLASCPVSHIIQRNNSLEIIEKLLLFDSSKKNYASYRENLLDHEDELRLNNLRSSLGCWLDRTVISLYLILTKLSIQFKDSKLEQNGNELNAEPETLPSQAAEEAIKELFSIHEEYVRLLPGPKDLTTPMFWNEAELEKLTGTLLHHSIIEQRELWRKESENLMLDIGQVSPLWHALLSRHISCDDYFWASTIVNSRSFPSNLLRATTTSSQGEDNQEEPPKNLSVPSSLDHNIKSSVVDANPILLPGVDIFNHKRAAKVEWRSIILDSMVQKIQLISLEDQIAPGEQVFNNYGPKSTGELILGYGFALSGEDWKPRADRNEDECVKNPSNPDDMYTIKLSKPKKAYSSLIEKIFSSIKEEEMMHHIGRNGEIPLLLLAQLRILVISTQEEIDQISLLFHHHDPSIYFKFSLNNSLKFTKISWFNELNTLDCLISLVRLKLEDLNKFNHLSDLSTDWNQVRHSIKKMIQIYRQGQRDILESALQHLNETFYLTLDEAKKEGFEYNLDDECEL